ncbi:MAG: polyprenol monophosphomannose synthase [Gemmataceae bacterium]
MAALRLARLSVPSPPRVLVSLATYNERPNLELLLPAIVHYWPLADILVIDDNSPDGTGEYVRQLASQDRRFRLIARPSKLGLGTAVLAGMRYAIEQDYDLFVNMDADLSHDPRHLPALLAGMDQHDVMIGSRYIPGGKTVDWPLSRYLISRMVNLLVRFLFRFRARDLSGSYRCYRVSKLREARLEQVRSQGYSFMQEVLFLCQKVGCRIGETPIVFVERKVGASKVSLFESLRSLGRLLRLGIPTFFGFLSR